MSAPKQITLKPTKRFRRRLMVEVRNGEISCRLLPATTSKFFALAFATEPPEKCRVLFDAPTEPERAASFIVGSVHFPVTFPEGEYLVKVFGFTHYQFPAVGPP